MAGTHGNVCLTHEEFKELLTNGRKWAINEVSEWKVVNGVTTYKNTTDYQLCKKWNKKRNPLVRISFFIPSNH